MTGWSLYCPRCGWEGPSEEYYPWCPLCGGPLEIRGSIPRPGRVLGEGGTPLVQHPSGAVYKLENLNPTGSFKDRGVALSTFLAKKLDYKCVTVDSSGNTAISTAAYAAWLGMEARVHIPAAAPAGKKTLLRLLGAKVREHPTRQHAALASRRDAGACYHIAHPYSPVFLEGVSGLGEELSEKARELPILVPVSSGTLLLGIARGLRRSGVTPKLIAVQGVGNPTLKGMVPLVVIAGGGTSDLADALVLRDPPRLQEIARNASGLILVDDESIRRALRTLFSRGIIAEPTSAATEAAAQLSGLQRSIRVISGSGLKYVEKTIPRALRAS